MRLQLRISDSARPEVTHCGELRRLTSITWLEPSSQLARDV
jgi:hypothetical protein